MTQLKMSAAILLFAVPAGFVVALFANGGL